MTGWADLVTALRERGFEVTHAVRVVDPGAFKLWVVNTARELTGWGFARARDAVESRAPICDSVNISWARHDAAKLRYAGATVEIGVGEQHLYAFDPADPRRGDQPIERIRVHGSAIAFERGRLGAWTREPTTPLDPDELLAAIDGQRRRWAEAGKCEAPSELPILLRSSARDLAAEDRLRSADGDARAREAALYGDWLRAQGDPRGPIAAAAVALEQAGDDAALRDERRRALDRLVSAHVAHLFGPVRWLVERGRWTWRGPVLDTLAIEFTKLPPLVGELLHTLFAAPICACLRELELAGPFVQTNDLGAVLGAAAWAPGLRALRITGVWNMTLRGAAFARLEHLTLTGGTGLGDAKLPALRTLVVDMRAPWGRLGGRFGTIDAPALEHLAISVDTRGWDNDYWNRRFGPLQDDLFALLAQPGFARLRTLKIGGGPLVAGFADALARIPAIATLERVDLSDATMSAECRGELERSRERLPPLRGACA